MKETNIGCNEALSELHLSFHPTSCLPEIPFPFASLQGMTKHADSAAPPQGFKSLEKLLNLSEP